MTKGVLIAMDLGGADALCNKDIPGSRGYTGGDGTAACGTCRITSQLRHVLGHDWNLCRRGTPTLTVRGVLRHVGFERTIPISGEERLLFA